MSAAAAQAAGSALSPGPAGAAPPERARGGCYRLLAACFYTPDQELWLAERLVENLCALLAQVCPAALEPGRRMQAALSRATAEDLVVEHTRLFVGPYHVLAPPYGSVYLEPGRRVMGDSTLEVQEAYRRAGLRLDPDVKEPPDHVATELEFAYYLTARAAEAEDAGQPRVAAETLATRDAFLARFLSRWAPEFCASIREATAHPFYRGLADCLAAVLAEPRPPSG